MSYWYYDDDDSYEDDTTLADHETSASSLVIDGPIRAESKRGDIGREWWGRQWVNAMEYLGLDGRLGRGKRYARNGSVLRLEISHGMVYAEVKGSRSNSYRTAINLKTLSDAEWKQALDALSEQAIYAAKLLMGEMPGDIEAVFQHAGLSLFPKTKHDIDFVCSCPDWGDPCKHAAAVYYLVAEQLDVDPFILFHIRGRNRETILQALRSYDITIEDGDEEDISPPLTVTDFWQEVDMSLVRQMPTIMEDPFALRQLGNPPGHMDKDLKKLYRAISDEAQGWLGLK